MPRLPSLPAHGPSGRAALIGLALALLLALAGWLALRPPMPPSPAVPADERLLPALADRIDAAARIAIDSRDGRFALVRSGDGWGLADRADYPVRPDQVADLLQGLAELRRLEPRTARPEYHSRLAVEAPDRPGARSLRVTVSDGAGRALGDLILGHRPEDDAAARYVRPPDSPQSWLAAGSVAIPRDPRQWLAPEIVDIAAARVAEIELTGPNRASLLLERPAPGQGFVPVDPPEGGAAADPALLDAVAGLLAELTLRDVRPAAEVFFPASGPRATVTTFDGLIVIAALGQAADTPGQLWARFDIARVPRLQDGPVVPGLLDDAAVARQADLLNARLSGWAYRLPTDRLALLLTDWDRLTAPAR